MAEDDEVVANPLRHASVLTLDAGFRQTVVPEPHRSGPGPGDERLTMPKLRRAGKRRRTLPTPQSAHLIADLRSDEARFFSMDDRAVPARSTDSVSRGGESQARTKRYVSRITRNTLAVIMAGGRGERLKHLTDFR